MLRLNPTSALAAPALVLAFAACHDPVAPPIAVRATTPLLNTSSSVFGAFDPLRTSASCVAPPSLESDFATYKPFDIPSGYQQRILATEIQNFLPVAGTGADLPDMMTLNETGPQAGRFMYRTHEVRSNGALTVTDMKTGITTLADQQPHYESLDGIVWTPWGTVLFAEERIVSSFKDPNAPNAVGGHVYEYNPVTKTTTLRAAVGARSHEGLRFDRFGNLYGISESTPGVNGSGALYKFVPDVAGDLSAGQLYALKVAHSSTRTGKAAWVALDRNAVLIDSDAEAIATGATGWGRPEDVEIVVNNQGTEIMYVASTSENLVLRIELRSATDAFVSNFVKEGDNVTGLNNPDNLALDAVGNLYVVEDNGPGDIWVARTNGHRLGRSSAVQRFASLSDCSAEPTGLYVNKTGTVAWVHVQHAGGVLRNDLFVEVTKP
ncbi:MAG: alkaline phosphatase PhoX [Gemmatimonadaceae bacterium]